MTPAFDFVAEPGADLTLLDDFIEELRAIPNAGERADDLADWLADQESEELLKALAWIAGHRERGLIERLDAMMKLMALPGPLRVSLCELTGWR